MNTINKNMVEFANNAKIWFEANPKGWTYTDQDIEESHEMGGYLAIRWGIHERAICICRLDCGFTPMIMMDWIDEKTTKKVSDE